VLLPRATDAGCPFPGPDRRLGEWRADERGNLAACSPWTANAVGAVPIGPGREGPAWQFRSQQTSNAGDPNYLRITGARGTVLPAVTVDVRARQVGFNAYAGSNRFIVATGWQDFAQFGPGEFVLYLHENREVYFLVKVGAAFVQRVDWHSCGFEARDVPFDQWVRYTGVYDGDTVSCYRDGQLMTSVRLPAQPPGGIGDLVVGRNYPGDVDALRIFDRALTPDEIARPWP
jgi:hypothetical protein